MNVLIMSQAVPLLYFETTETNRSDEDDLRPTFGRVFSSSDS